MPFTDNFRRQHDDILSLAQGLADMLDVGQLRADAGPARSKLTALAGKLKVHLAMEDQSLYPMAAASGNASLASLANRYRNDMGGIKEAFESYLAKWASPAAIQSDAEAFVRESQAIQKALAERVSKENSELYPLVDAHA